MKKLAEGRQFTDGDQQTFHELYLQYVDRILLSEVIAKLSEGVAQPCITSKDCQKPGSTLPGDVSE